jgi:cytochrome o ubiquinol oxidase operon protein cyoD
MSAGSHAGPHPHGAAPEGHDVHDGEEPHGSLKDYVIGFVLSVILTAIPFWLVMGHVFKNPTVTAFSIMGLAGIQIVVHMIYFLHMTPKAEGGWNMLALIFTLVLVTIALSGSMWVMYHLNNNMMPTSLMTGANMATETMNMGNMTEDNKIGGNTTDPGDMGGMTMAPPTSARDPRTMP